MPSPAERDAPTLNGNVFPPPRHYCGTTLQNHNFPRPGASPAADLLGLLPRLVPLRRHCARFLFVRATASLVY